MPAKPFHPSDSAGPCGHYPRMVSRIGSRRALRIFLSEHRRHRGLTQQQVADRIGIHEQTVSKYERQAASMRPGSAKPSIAVLSEFAAAYDCEVEDLFHPPGRPTPNQLMRDQPDEVTEQAIRLLSAIRRNA